MKLKSAILILWGALNIAGLPLFAGDYFNPASFQYNMTITGTFLIDNVNIGSQDTLFAFSGSECRGFVSPKYEDGVDQWFAYLVIYGHGTSEQIDFKYYDANTDQLVELKNLVIFQIDGILGNPGHPYVFSNRVLSVNDKLSGKNITVRQLKTTLIIDLQNPALIELIDLSGRVIYRRNLSQGRTEVTLDEIKSDIYILRLYNKNNIFTKKIFL